MIEVRSPQKPDLVLGSFQEFSESEVAATAATARSVQREWSRDPVMRSIALRNCVDAMKRNESDLVSSAIVETGKPFTEAKGEFNRTIAILEYYSSAVLDPVGNVLPSTTPNLLFTTRSPHGIAGLITPWNFPIAIPIWKAAPALAGGNCVLLKPSEFATKTAMLLGSILNEVLPKHVFNVVSGSGQTGTALIKNADVVSFTGSVATGNKVVAQAAQMRVPVQAEMGGNSPAIILDDANMNEVVSQLMIGAFSYSGQKCTATRRIIVLGSDKRKREVIDALEAGMNSLVVGDPTEKSTFVSPLINRSAQASFFNVIEQCVSAAGKLVRSKQELPSEGWYVHPTITYDIPIETPLLKSELFGPLAHVISVKDEQDAVAVANAVSFGLTASIHTQNLTNALKMANELETGIVKVNAPTAGVDFYAPFGGIKDSSYGMREQGKAAMDFYTFTRTISMHESK